KNRFANDGVSSRGHRFARGQYSRGVFVTERSAALIGRRSWELSGGLCLRGRPTARRTNAHGRSRTERLGAGFVTVRLQEIGDDVEILLIGQAAIEARRHRRSDQRQQLCRRPITPPVQKIGTRELRAGGSFQVGE